MSILQTLEGTATELRNQMGPVAERVRETADELIERLGTESRQLGEMLGERAAAQLEQLPDTALKRFKLVPARKARRRMIFGVILGLLAGAAVTAWLNQQNNRQLRTGGWQTEDPAAAGGPT